MSRRLVLYVGSVVASAIVLMALHPLDWTHFLRWHWLAWVAITVVAESLWLPTITGEGTDSMASSANFATVVLWGVAPAIWIVALSTAVADLALRRRPPIRALFNTAAMVVVMVAAGWTFRLLGGPKDGIWILVDQAPRLEVARMVGFLIPLLGLGLVYRVLNIGLVATATGWGAERPIMLVIREDYLYAEQLTLRKQAVQTEEAAAVAAFLLSPRSSGINAQNIVVDAGMSTNYFDREIVRRAMRPQ